MNPRDAAKMADKIARIGRAFDLAVRHQAHVRQIERVVGPLQPVRECPPDVLARFANPPADAFRLPLTLDKITVRS